MTLQVYDGNTLIAELDYTRVGDQFLVENCMRYSIDPISYPSGLCHEQPDIVELFSKRLAPSFRFNSILKEAYKLERYDAEKMCRLTHGVTPQDFFWFKFGDDDPTLCWDNVKLRD